MSTKPRRVCAIHQPHYLPWLRYFDKIARADVFILLDDIQYTRNGWQNRNRIKGANGPFVLTVPVRHRFCCPLPEVEIADDRWRRRHLEALRTSYGRAPGFALLLSLVEPLLSRPHTHLVELNAEMLLRFCAALGITTPIVRSSLLGVDGTASDRLAQLCAAVGASHYLSGAFAAQAYLEPERLLDRDIQVLYHRWEAPTYRQCHPGAGFLADLSIVDLIAAAGDAAAAVLASGGGIESEPPAHE